MAMSVVLRMVCGVTLALASARPAGAADAPAAATSHSAGLTVSGAGPYFTLHLPMAIQSQASTVDLSDLQVHNARGDALPFAWVAARPLTSEQHRQAVTIFKLPGAASGAKIGPSRGWMFDVRGVAGSLVKLELVLPAAAR
ncbi:MAG: DUF3999 domain-containing protein, partial [Betaproteobacteria bacterium]